MKPQEPKIIYRTVTINKKNLKNILSVRHGGYFNCNKNTITIFKYVLSDKMPILKKRRVLAFIKEATQEHEKIVVHEKRHWHNHSVFYSTNYYQEMSLDCFDEVSCIAAGILYNDPEYKLSGVRQVIVACSMLEATSQFLDNDFDKYMKRFIDDIVQNYRWNVRVKGLPKTIANLQELQNTYKNDPDTLFDKKFNESMKYFFTFDGYCIFNDGIHEHVKDVWKDVEDNMAMIAKKCLEETFNAIESIVKMGTKCVQY